MPDEPDLVVRHPDEPDTAPEPLAARLWRWARTLVLYGGGFLLLFTLIGRLRAPDLPPQAPDFTLTALDGGTVSLSGLRGQQVVVNFWATWCGPCQLEMPTLRAFAENNPDVQVLYVAVDGSPDALRAFAREHELPLERVLVGAGTNRAYGVSTLPTTVVVEPDGSIGAAHAGIVLAPQLWWWTR